MVEYELLPLDLNIRLLAGVFQSGSWCRGLAQGHRYSCSSQGYSACFMWTMHHCKMHEIKQKFSRPIEPEMELNRSELILRKHWILFVAY